MSEQFSDTAVNVLWYRVSEAFLDCLAKGLQPDQFGTLVIDRVAAQWEREGHTALAALLHETWEAIRPLSSGDVESLQQSMRDFWD